MPYPKGAAPADYDAFEPSQQLRPFVHRYLYGWSQHPEGSQLQIRPTGGVFLSYLPGAPLRAYFREHQRDTRTPLFIGGQLRDEQPILESQGRLRLIGVEMRPTGFYRLFGHDASQFTDDLTDMEAAFPGHAASLTARLNAEGGIDDIIQGIESYLLELAEHAVDTPRVDRAVRRIGEQRGLISIDALAQESGWSVRQLRRQFTRVVGVPPKHYAKIVQVNTVVAALMSENFDALQALALDHGYYDHAHFIRDFQQLVGSNPTEFMRSGSPFLRTFLGNASH
jgi:AraC-like DNA-binding protein